MLSRNLTSTRVLCVYHGVLLYLLYKKKNPNTLLYTKRKSILFLPRGLTLTMLPKNVQPTNKEKDFTVGHFFSAHRAFVKFIRSILSFSLLSKNPHHQTVHPRKAVEAFHRFTYRYALFRKITDKSVNFTNNCAEIYTFAYELRRLQV